jgi:hypothetical protein
MSPDGIVFATLALVAVALLLWLAWRRLQPPPQKTPEEQRAATWDAVIVDHVIDATSKSGRTPWL